MSALELLCRAEVSSDLKHHSDKFTDVDVLGAAGMVAANQFLATALYRTKYLHDTTEIESAKRLFIRWARVAMLARKISAAGASRLGVQALSAWLNDVCPCCHGHGYMPIPGTPSLSDVPCPMCDHTGKRRLQHKGLEREVVHELHGRADAAVGTVGRCLEYKMGRCE